MNCGTIYFAFKNSYVNARSVFEEMKREGVVPDRHSWMTLLKKRCYDPQQSSIDGDGKGDTNSKLTESNCDVVKKLFDDMVDNGIKPDLPAWNIVLNSHAICKSSPKVVRKLMDEIRKSGITPDVYSWSALMRCYDQPLQIRYVMKEMRDAGLDLNAGIWSLLLKSCKNPADARGTWEEMIAAGITPNSNTYSVLFNIFLGANCPEEVTRVFNEELKVKPYLVTNYVANAIIRAFVAEGNETEITKFWEKYCHKLKPIDIRLLENYSSRHHQVSYTGRSILRALLQRTNESNKLNSS